MEIDFVEAHKRLTDLMLSKLVVIDWCTAYEADYGDSCSITYRVGLDAMGERLEVRYTVGSSVPLTDYRGANDWATRWPWPRTIDAVNIRAGIRAAYRPDEVAVVASVLLDIGMTDGFADWAEWAIELGTEFGTAEDIRNAEDAFRTIRTRYRPWAERAFGADLPEAIELAGAL